MLPAAVKLVEVGARDGLQNEARTLPVDCKVELIERLAAAGLRHIEAGSFVSPRWVPQMADSSEVLAKLRRRPGVTYAALTPNTKGMDAALAAGADEIAVFTAASETFSHKNTNCSIDESLARIESMLKIARSREIAVRGYVSCVVGCPYEGEIAASRVADIAGWLIESGCYEVSLGDTVGVGTPNTVRAMLEAVNKKVPLAQMAVHFHDTYGQALTNIYAALQLGVAAVDSSISGLGGCPYAKGASGNVATEDVAYMLNGLDVETGIDLAKLLGAGLFINRLLNRTAGSKVALAMQE